MGLSPQRPPRRAYQQNPAAVQKWKTEIYPAIRADAEAAGGTIYFADEAGIRSDYHADTTWAPVGQTPIVKNTGARHSVNMLSAVTPQGALKFTVHEGTVNAAVFIDFCKRLMHDTTGPVYLIVDGHPSHRAKMVKEFVASTNGQLQLFFLPDYSAELNPDEWVWKNVKHDRIGKIGVTSQEDLEANHRSPPTPAKPSPPGPRLLRRPASELHHHLKPKPVDLLLTGLVCAGDLVCWTKLICFTGTDLARVEINTFRYRVLHVAGQSMTT